MYVKLTYNINWKNTYKKYETIGAWLTFIEHTSTINNYYAAICLETVNDAHNILLSEQNKITNSGYNKITFLIKMCVEGSLGYVCVCVF